MPRLKSVHLSRVGHPAARLDGVTIYFTAKGDPEGRPAESTILALRNGGGKTSFLQLLFSTFVPDKREFSGRTSEGGERTFDQYFQPNDLGMIVTEWNLGENMPTRIIGQCVVKTAVSDTNPQQCFFSFLVTDPKDDFQVTDLPMRQFKNQNNPGNASSFNAFKQLLRSDFAMRPHQQLVITETQRDWLKNLRTWGFEPDLFRLLIALNKSEGGSIEMAKNKFGTTEKMIGLIAMLSTSEQDRKKGKGSSNIHDLILQYREDLLHLPEKEIEQKMWTQLHNTLTSLIEPGLELVKAENEKRQALSQVTAIGQKILASPGVLQGKIDAKTKREESLEGKKLEKETCIQGIGKKRLWIDRQILNLTLAKAKEVFEKAEGNKTVADQYYRALKVHNLRAGINSLDGRRQGIKASIKEATKPTEDIEDTLHAIGSQLDELIEGQLKATSTRKNGADERSSQAEIRLTKLNNEEKEKSRISGQFENQLSTLDKWFQAVAAKRSDLNLNDRQAVDVLAAVEGKLDKDCSKLELLKEEEKRLNKQIIELHKKQTETETQLKTAQEQQNEQAEQHDIFRKAYEQIAFDTELCLLIEDDEVDPYSPLLPELLKDKQNRLGNKNSNLTTEQRRCQESLNFLEGEYKLMPPQEDVWFVCEALKDEDIQASPYVKYLSEINKSPGQIRELLTQDPARYGGACIVNSKDMQKAMDIVGNLQALRGPVQIYPLDKHTSETTSSSASESGVALPLSNATFSVSDAATERARLTHEIKERKEQINDIQQQIDIITKATKNLHTFLTLYPDGTKKNLDLIKKNLDSRVEALAEQLENVKSHIKAHEGDIDENNQKLGVVDNEIRTGQEAYQHLEHYVTEFESIIPEKKKEQQECNHQFKVLNTRLGAITTEVQEQVSLKRQAEDESTAFQNTINELSKLRKGVEHTDTSRGKIPENIPAEDMDSLQAAYDALQRDYNDKNQHIQGLVAKIELLKEQISEKEKEFDNLQVDTIPESVLANLKDQYGANSIDGSILRVASVDREEAIGKMALAKKELGDSELELNKFSHLSSELLEPEDMYMLNTMESCSIRKEGYADEIQTIRLKIKRIEGQLGTLRSDIVMLNKDIGYLTDLAKTVESKIQVEDNVDLSNGYDDYEEAFKRWNETDQAYTQALNVERSKSSAVKKIKDILTQILADEKYNRIAPLIRQRIHSQMNTLHLDAVEFTSEAQNALDSVEYTLSKTRDQQNDIVEYLMDDVRAIKSNMDALNRISKIPETDTNWAKWSGRRFFKVRIDGEQLENGYCRTKIEEFVQKLVRGSDKTFPTNAMDIIEGVTKFALKDITTITTMKPDHFMSTNPETLEEAAKWSGGEGFTYAALSLMVFNQLICHINASVKQPGGILVVDNPIGTCNHLEFIKLQQIMAGILDNQLIYPTAVKDFDALSLFPNVVALSNNRVDGRTGYHHVEVEGHTHHIPEITTAHMTFSEAV